MSARLKIHARGPQGMVYAAREDNRGALLQLTREQVAAHNGAIDRAAKLSAAAEYIADREKELEQKRRKLADLAWLAESARKAREAEQEIVDIQARLAAKDAKERAANVKFGKTLRRLQKQFAHAAPATVQAQPPVAAAIAASVAAPVQRPEPIVYDTVAAVEEWHRTPKYIVGGVILSEPKKPAFGPKARLTF